MQRQIHQWPVCFDKLIIGPFEFWKIKVKPDRDNAISLETECQKLLEFHTHKKSESSRHLKWCCTADTAR